MSADDPTLKELATCPKRLASRPEWMDDHPTLLRFVVPLETSGATIGGLELRAAASKTLQDRAVMFQTEIFPVGRKRTQLHRIEWRPIGLHVNPPKGPKALRLLEINGSHDHEFDLNWIEEEDRMRAGNLPIARPIEPDLTSYEDFLDFCADRLKIEDMRRIPRPKWQPDFFRV